MRHQKKGKQKLISFNTRDEYYYYLLLLLDNSCTDGDDYLNIMNLHKYEERDDEYKDKNSQTLNSNESVINKIEPEEALTDWLMSMIFQIMLLMM